MIRHDKQTTQDFLAVYSILKLQSRLPMFVRACSRSWNSRYHFPART
ncbi:hypothetical protein RchiOBHm_Chr7g0210471 [Rosa chinensis]|uniref:Uncharacterized protein n=1 Tax=Rosa chinensis TaxID=74649 RepID=A0A2P6PA80_ROSCH|nr:hypothetical protein RchiOBHm_Chr7g0210471 [Rosa chinensis]